MFIGTSIGISIFPDHGSDVDTLIRNADLAMYEVKHNGGYGYEIYSAEMSNKAVDKLKIDRSLIINLEEGSRNDYSCVFISFKITQ